MTITAKTQLNCKEMCKKIMKLDSSIKFVGLINDRGKCVTSEYRKGAKFLTTKKDLEMLFMEAALRIRMRHGFNNILGPVNFTISHRNEIIIMTMPFGNDFLYLSAEKEFNFGKIPFKILDFLKQNEALRNLV